MHGFKMEYISPATMKKWLVQEFFLPDNSWYSYSNLLSKNILVHYLSELEGRLEAFDKCLLDA